jgi:hypothetical protein
MLLLDGVKPGTNESIIPTDVVQKAATGITVVSGISWVLVSTSSSYFLGLTGRDIVAFLSSLRRCTVEGRTEAPIEDMVLLYSRLT